MRLLASEPESSRSEFAIRGHVSLRLLAATSNNGTTMILLLLLPIIQQQLTKVIVSRIIE